MNAFIVSIKLNKNIQKNLFQTCLNQLLVISTVSLNEIIHEKHLQNKSENAFQKLIQNENCEKHFQIFSSQLQNTKNNILFISEFIFIQISMMNSQMLINCLQK